MEQIRNFRNFFSFLMEENEMNGKTLKQRLIDAGYSESEMYHHCSDLYVFATTLTKKIIEEWCKELGLDMDWNCPMFKDAITGRPMYDCAFQYY